MSGLDSGAVEAVIERGIKDPIRFLLEASRYPAAIALTYSGMDTMAFLNMAGHRDYVMRSDFIAWTERYVKIALPDPPTGKDLYGTRCTVLHGGARSRFTHEGRGRNLQVPAIKLVRAFFAGMDMFLAELADDAERAEIANRRLGELRTNSAYD